jgi:hypothetical protein
MSLVAFGVLLAIFVLCGFLGLHRAAAKLSMVCMRVGAFGAGQVRQSGGGAVALVGVALQELAHGKRI